MSLGRLLLLGGAGQVGRALIAGARGRFEVLAPTSTELDITDAAGLERLVRQSSPDAIVNLAAYTRVDDAEGEEGRAMEINAGAAGALARVAAAASIRLIHLSTDYVFDGEGGAPYATDATVAPLNAYGRTKAAGEVAVREAHPGAVVLRTAWVHSGGDGNFVATAVRLLSEGRTMTVVDDQVGTPTRSNTLAEAIIRIVQRPELRGTLHFTDAGVASWYDVAHCVLETMRAVGRADATSRVVPVASSALTRAAPRPRVALLDKHDTWRQIDWTPPHWRDGVIASTTERLHASH